MPGGAQREWYRAIVAQPKANFRPLSGGKGVNLSHFPAVDLDLSLGLDLDVVVGPFLLV